MTLEIERKYLVKGNDWKKLIISSQDIKQCYLTTSKKEWTTRIRLINNKKAILSLKKPINYTIRYEYEYDIPIEDGNSIFNLTDKQIIKTRYSIKFQGGDWIVDSFKGSNFPLVLAEVEIASERTLIQAPSWCIKEVTDESKYSNAALAENPISKWQNTATNF
tara:strand:- start:4060 stop:4548 length:489 start_codon:yes stop_codon:yes gene_type:complete